MHSIYVKYTSHKQVIKSEGSSSEHYLTVILRGRAGYELIYITNEAVGRVGYYQLISGKSEKNNWRQQKPHKFAYLTMENSTFARFARAYFIFWHFEDVLVLSTTWNDLFCSCVDDVSIWWQMFNFVFLCPKRLFQFNTRTVRTQFSSIKTLNN